MMIGFRGLDVTESNCTSETEASFLLRCKERRVMVSQTGLMVSHLRPQRSNGATKPSLVGSCGRR
jgi:hypothetical protein